MFPIFWKRYKASLEPSIASCPKEIDTPEITIPTQSPTVAKNLVLFLSGKKLLFSFPV